MQVTCHKKIFIAKPTVISEKEFDGNLRKLFYACQMQREQLNTILKAIDPHYLWEYKPEELDRVSSH
jgi:hypothetical protein